MLEGVVTGLCSREIAEELGLSVKTVESHRVRIMKKMQASSVPHLVRMTLLATAQ